MQHQTDFEKAMDYVFDTTKSRAPIVTNGLKSSVVVGFEPRLTKTLARCYYNMGAITYGYNIIDLNKNNKRGLDHIITHELSHFVDHTHGHEFKQNMLRHGFDHNNAINDVVQPHNTKFLICKECGHVSKPRSKIAQNYHKSKCEKCGYAAYVPCRYDTKSKEIIEMKCVETSFDWLSFVDKVKPEYELDVSGYTATTTKKV